MKVIAIKIGSSVLLTQRNRLDEFRIAHIADQILALREKGIGVVLVVSGAVACAANFVHFSSDDRELKRVAAGVGQVHLISTFQQVFSQKRFRIAQVLLTKNLRVTSNQAVKGLLESYLKMGIVSVINENDAVDLNSFGGNDLLSVEIAKLLRVDKLLILSTMIGSAYGVGGGESKLQALEILKKEHIQAAIVDGRAQNIILQSLL